MSFVLILRHLTHDHGKDNQGEQSGILSTDDARPPNTQANHPIW